MNARLLALTLAGALALSAATHAQVPPPPTNGWTCTVENVINCSGPVGGGSLNPGSGPITIPLGSIIGQFLAPGAAAFNLGFNPVQSFEGRTGVVTLQADDIAAALGFQPVGASSIVTSFNMRTGIVTLQPDDISTALGFTPADAAHTVLTFNGRPGMVSLTSGDVTSALGFTPASSAAGVASFNTRTGAISLSSADVTGALGFTPADASAAGVTAFNSRTGAVSLTGADVTAALGFVPPANSAVVASFNGRTGPVTPQASDVTGALGFTPASSAAVVSSFNGRAGAVTPLTADVTGALGYTPLTNAAGGVAASNLAAGAAVANLGFTPVTQGGGVGQLTNRVFLGWSSAGLKVTVDATDEGLLCLQNTPAPCVRTFNGRQGAVTLASSDVTGALGFTPGAGVQVAEFQEQEASGTGSAIGSIPATTWTRVVLNLQTGNNIPGSTLSGNQFSLPAGLYQIRAFSTSRAGTGAQTAIRLRNVTDGTTTIVGQGAGFAPATLNTVPTLLGTFTVPSPSKAYEIDIWCGGTLASGGFPISSGEAEVYSDVQIEKVG